MPRSVSSKLKYIWGFFSGPVYMVLVQQFSIFPCIKQWNEWFYFAFIFNGVWIAFRETCNTPFHNNTLPKLQSRKSHSNVLTFLTVRLLIFRCVIISYTHLYTCRTNMLAGCDPFFLFHFQCNWNIFSLLEFRIFLLFHRVHRLLFIYSSNNFL